MKKLLFGADIVPTNSNERTFSEGELIDLVGEEIERILQSADFISLNLETPITDISTPIVKCGPNLRANTCTFHGYKLINSCFYTLANNHIMDQGTDGLIRTIKLLDENGINYAGAGMNLKEARVPYIFQLDGTRYGIYSCCEHEFSGATNDEPGANEFDPILSNYDIKQMCDQVDYGIVLFHGGKEYYRYPSPGLQKICRSFVDSGANLVIVQHTHCIGCMENYHAGTIVYGQGNFLFDGESDEFWNSSLIVSLEECNKEFKIAYIPIVKENHVIRAATQNESEMLLAGFLNRSSEIENTGFVEEQYKKFADKYTDLYLRLSMGHIGTHSLLFRSLNRLFKKNLSRKMFTKENLLSLQNIIECESNREVFIQLLKDNIAPRKD